MTDNSYQEDYESLRDKIIELFNPHDGEESELFLLEQSLTKAHRYIDYQYCDCKDEDDGPCPRCDALGQFKRVDVER